MLEVSPHFISFAELNVVPLISSEFHYDYTLYISFNFMLNVGGFSVSNFYFHLSCKNRYKEVYMWPMSFEELVQLGMVQIFPRVRSVGAMNREFKRGSSLVPSPCYKY